MCKNKFLISVSGGETQLEMKTLNELKKGSEAERERHVRDGWEQMADQIPEIKGGVT